jgi:ABC-2 type transport system permease protein
VRGIVGAARMQLQLVARDRSYLNEMIANPFFAIIFLGIVRAARREDLTGFAMVAPVLITLWNMAIEISGGIVDSDRWHGTVEGVVASPVGYPSVILGRVLAVSFLGLFGVVETGIVARVGFGASVTVHHPDVLVGGLVVTALAMTGTATLLAAVFVLTRTAGTFQNTMNYPFYLLGGVLVPLSFLPSWIRPAGRLIFLSWSADLLRDSLRAAPVDDVALRCAVVLGLGAAGLAAGRLVLGIVLDRVRDQGTLSHV